MDLKFRSDHGTQLLRSCKALFAFRMMPKTLAWHSSPSWILCRGIPLSCPPQPQRWAQALLNLPNPSPGAPCLLTLAHTASSTWHPTSGPFTHPHACVADAAHPRPWLAWGGTWASYLSPWCSPMASPAGPFLLLLVTCPLNWLPMPWSSVRESPGLYPYNTYWVLKVCLRKEGRKEARKGMCKLES